jgi:hypothetical protein
MPQTDTLDVYRTFLLETMDAPSSSPCPLCGPSRYWSKIWQLSGEPETPQHRAEVRAALKQRYQQKVW